MVPRNIGKKMTLSQNNPKNKWLRFSRWISVIFFASITIRTIFYLGSKIYFGVSFAPADIFIVIIGFSSAWLIYIYLKALLNPQSHDSNV